MFFVNSKIKKAILNYCNKYLKPEYKVAQISTFTKTKMPCGGYYVYVKIFEITSGSPKLTLGYTCGNFYLDKDFNVVGNDITQKEKVFYEFSIIQEAEDILKEIK